MGQGPVLALCGKNLGYFPDEHASPANSDEEGDVDSEREKYMPKSHREAIGLSKQDCPNGRDCVCGEHAE